MARGGQNYFYHSDGLGSITEITDNTGTVVKSYTYDSFGNIVNETGTLNNPYTYTGRERDSESGLYFYRARYMDPKTGRFLQEDPIWNVNNYIYAEDNPVNFIDPYGENLTIAATTVVAAIIGITVFTVLKSLEPNLKKAEEIRKKQIEADFCELPGLEEERLENLEEGIKKLEVGTEAISISTLTTTENQATFILQELFGKIFNRKEK